MNRNYILLFSLAAFALSMLLLAAPATGADKGEVNIVDQQEPLSYQLLFFKNDNRAWIIIPPRTTLVEIFPSVGKKWGWVKAYNRWGETLAVDNNFHGSIFITSAVKRPAVRHGKIVASRHDGQAVAIFTPENAAFVEIINAENGFDGVVYVRDKKKRVLSSQSGLDLRVVNLN
jgi:hypothetical protein